MARSVLICSLRSLRIAPGKPLPSSLASHQPANPERLRSLVRQRRAILVAADRAPDAARSAIARR
jgi:hypothetical protein